MNDRIWFVLYLSAVMILGVVHNEWIMLLSIIVTLALGGKARWKIFFKTVLVIALFNATISISYVIYGFFMPVDIFALVLINLRALAITLLTFTLVRRINLHKALEFSRVLAILYGFTYAQIILLKSMLYGYYDGLKSRGATLGSAITKKQLQPLLITLFGTMLHKSNEQSMGLRSRGLIDD
ncbi:MAG: hypothetical protein A2513_00440 [Sulfurimonas sp. RIFOXYD12_FULL_33_39]|uniref:hypothetical protein n=1 Tax=unclassified Sulfurimonas TaxID=2623549 RepID=UPI0008D279BD|nr:MULTISPECIES: hypothetical protein [unclassified Sulfurimonas]OHE02410.1 MAG: hypothetical protein A3G74_05605 [Sulfurimonas sp. RIFCSPLOWO2_12_FULL_34_6]OHE10797.1 MAG: hypothetical protein A2513_00440 [Sulfurimonas sp. RIFOXYD12_FULL_33_39]OHE13433.1 MAG: hypothetical protein A2530_07740 [Sulfurimonas sp. RIFOXYD2_FULL_34_21]